MKNTNINLHMGYLETIVRTHEGVRADLNVLYKRLSSYSVKSEEYAEIHQKVISLENLLERSSKILVNQLETSLDYFEKS